MQPDSLLVNQVRGGDVSAFKDLVVRYSRAGMLTALRILRDHHLAEDVVQESFVVAYRRLNSLRDASKFGGWFVQIVTRQALRKRKEARVEISIESVQQIPAVGENSESHECEQLMELISRLPLHERIVVTLRHLDGHSTDEIAEITGRPAGTVRKQLSRGVNRLRNMIALQGSSR